MNRISEFAEAFIPKQLPERRKKAIRDELCSHLYDAVDEYLAEGLSKDESIARAINDFGSDKETRERISREFEEIYGEKIIFGILSLIAIFFMNYLCVPLDIWSYSADFNRDPFPLGIFISSMMCLFVISMLFIARVKRLRWLAVLTGIANLLTGVCAILNFYPQMAGYALGANITFLIEYITPFTLGHDNASVYNIISTTLWIGFPLCSALYAFILAILMRMGRIGQCRRPVKKFIVLVAVYIAFSAASSLLYPVSEKYIDEYPLWFSEYDIYMTDESYRVYGGINIGDDYSDVCDYLHSEGYVTTEEFMASSDWRTRKQFRKNLEIFDFIDGYTIWFSPDGNIEGGGLIGTREENGILTDTGVGNLNKYLYYGKYNIFGLSSWHRHTGDDPQQVRDFFRELESGDSLFDVMDCLGRELGKIYTERVYVENGKTKHYYRIFFRGNPEGSYDEYVNYCMELRFSDLRLEKAVLYHKDSSALNDDVVKTYMNQP